jgi:hypothetical protein
MMTKLTVPILTTSAFLALGSCTVAYVPPPGGPPPPPPAGAPPAPAPAPPPPVAARPEMAGWRFMGDAWVTGRVDRDFIRVGRQEGRFARVMLVVNGGDLELYDLVIQFGNGQRWSPGVRHFFREGSRSRAIDLPGQVRFITGVELVYGNVRGGGRAHAEIWGQ